MEVSKHCFVTQSVYIRRKKKYPCFHLPDRPCVNPPTMVFLSVNKKIKRPTIRNFRFCDFSLEVYRNCHVGSRRPDRFMVNSHRGRFDLSQLAPFDWSIRTLALVNLHLYRTQVNSHISSFRTFSCKRRN